MQTSEAPMATDEDSAKRRLAFQKSYSLEVSAIRSATPTGRWNDDGLKHRPKTRSAREHMYEQHVE